jgi:hypothetical protein
MYPGTVYRKVDGVYSFLSTGTTRDIDIFVLLSFFLLSDAVKVFKILGYFGDGFARRHRINGSL